MTIVERYNAQPDAFPKATQIGFTHNRGTRPDRDTQQNNENHCRPTSLRRLLRCAQRVVIGIGRNCSSHDSSALRLAANSLPAAKRYIQLIEPSSDDANLPINQVQENENTAASKNVDKLAPVKESFPFSTLIKAPEPYNSAKPPGYSLSAPAALVPSSNHKCRNTVANYQAAPNNENLKLATALIALVEGSHLENHDSFTLSVKNLATIAHNFETADELGQLNTAATTAVHAGATNHCLWAQTQGLYLTPMQLEGWIAARTVTGGDKRTTPFLVVDVRDEDAIGGNVQGAIHCPDQTLEQAASLAALAIRALSLGNHGTIVFHCMESLRRGPRCAFRLNTLFDLLEKSLGRKIHRPKIAVLKGGADQWIRQRWDTPFVGNYDDDYWGFAADANAGTDLLTERSFESGPQHKRARSNEALARHIRNQSINAPITHKLYTAPKDNLTGYKPTLSTTAPTIFRGTAS